MNIFFVKIRMIITWFSNDMNYENIIYWLYKGIILTIHDFLFVSLKILAVFVKINIFVVSAI